MKNIKEKSIMMQMNPIKKLLFLSIRGYQVLIRPFLGDCCRYHPSCSEYAIEALQKYPVHKALWLTTKRIAKCNPFSKGGVDPLP